MTPELLDRWRAADELDHLLGNEQLVWTLAYVGSAVCGSNGMEIKPRVMVHGETDNVPMQTDAEQQAIAAQIMARQEMAI